MVVTNRRCFKSNSSVISRQSNQVMGSSVFRSNVAKCAVCPGKVCKVCTPGRSTCTAREGTEARSRALEGTCWRSGSTWRAPGRRTWPPDQQPGGDPYPRSVGEVRMAWERLQDPLPPHQTSHFCIDRPPVDNTPRMNTSTRC